MSFLRIVEPDEPAKPTASVGVFGVSHGDAELAKQAKAAAAKAAAAKAKAKNTITTQNRFESLQGDEEVRPPPPPAPHDGGSRMDYWRSLRNTSQVCMHKNGGLRLC